MVAIRREDKEEYLTAPDLVGEVAVLTDCLPELKTRSAPCLALLNSPVQISVKACTPWCCNNCSCAASAPPCLFVYLTSGGRLQTYAAES